MLTFSPGSCLVYVGRLVCCAYGYSITGGANNRFNVIRLYPVPAADCSIGYPEIWRFRRGPGEFADRLAKRRLFGVSNGAALLRQYTQPLPDGGRAN